MQGAHQSLHHFVANADWSDNALLRRVRELVLPVMTQHGGVRAWIVDDTGFPKKDVHSVGVARQYCGQLSNNAAERSLRGIALGRRNWTFAGSQRGADRAAVMLTMITTCRLNDVDPKAWLADVLARIADLPTSRLNELLPWEWSSLRKTAAAGDQKAA